MKRAKTGRHAAEFQPMRMRDFGPFVDHLPRLSKHSRRFAAVQT